MFGGTERRRSKRDPHTTTKSAERTCIHTLILIYGRSGTPHPASLRSVSARGHLLHGGYFLRQTGDHSKEPQVYEPICHSEVDHLQDLKQKNKEISSFSQSVTQSNTFNVTFPLRWKNWTKDLMGWKRWLGCFVSLWESSRFVCVCVCVSACEH